MDQTAARHVIGPALVLSLCWVAGGQAFPIEQRPEARMLLAGDRNGPVNPAPTPASTTHGATPSPGAPEHPHNPASGKGTRASPLVWAGATRLVRDSSPRSSSAFAQPSPIASSGLTPQAAQTARSPRAWLIGLIWVIWCAGFAWLVWFIWFVWFHHKHTTPPPHTTARSTDADGLFSVLPRGTDVPESTTKEMASRRGEGGSMPPDTVFTP